MIESIFSLIGQAVAFGGGCIAIGFGLFKWFGQKWIESKFNIQIKQMEFKQQETIARLKVEVESMLGGALKLQDREFSCLPATWDTLHESFSKVGALVFPGRTVPDFLSMDESELEEFLENQKWSKSEKRQLKEAKNKVVMGQVFSRINFGYEIFETEKSFWKFKNLVSANSIFYEDHLKIKLDKILKSLWDSIADCKNSDQGSDQKLRNQAYQTFHGKATPLRAEIETSIRDRLQSHRRLPQ